MATAPDPSPTQPVALTESELRFLLDKVSFQTQRALADKLAAAVLRFEAEQAMAAAAKVIHLPAKGELPAY